MNLPEYCIVCGAMNGWIHPRDADRHCHFNVCEFKELLPPWPSGPAIITLDSNYLYPTFITTTSADYVIHNYNSSTTTETE